MLDLNHLYLFIRLVGILEKRLCWVFFLATSLIVSLFPFSL